MKTKTFFSLMGMLLLITQGCTAITGQSSVETGVAGTMTALPAQNLFKPETLTPTATSKPVTGIRATATSKIPSTPGRFL